MKLAGDGPLDPHSNTGCPSVSPKWIANDHHAIRNGRSESVLAVIDNWRALHVQGVSKRDGLVGQAKCTYIDVGASVRMLDPRRVEF